MDEIKKVLENVIFKKQVNIASSLIIHYKRLY